MGKMSQYYHVRRSRSCLYVRLTVTSPESRRAAFREHIFQSANIRGDILKVWLAVAHVDTELSKLAHQILGERADLTWRGAGKVDHDEVDQPFATLYAACIAEIP